MTISITVLASVRRIASTTAISSNGFIDIFTFASSTPEDAVRLRKLFEFVGDWLGLRIDVAVTAAAESIGRGIGPVIDGNA